MYFCRFMVEAHVGMYNKCEIEACVGEQFAFK